MRGMAKLLIVKTSSLGDVVHALPVLSDLAHARPGLTVGWLVEEAFACLPALHPACGRVIPVALRRWRRSPLDARTRAEYRQMREQLVAFGATHILDLQGLLKSAWLSTVATTGSAQRLGYDWRSAREPLASLFYHQRHTVSRQEHAVVRNRQLAAAALGYPLDMPCAYGPLGGSAVLPGDSAPVAVLLHATSREDKLWPEARWIALGAELAREGLCCVLPSGSPAEAVRADRLAAAIPGARALSPGPLAQLLPVLASARLAVGVDTGLTHLATAFGLPVVALYTATDPAATGVYGSARACNLGGAGACPDVAAVLARLAGLGAFAAA